MKKLIFLLLCFCFANARAQQVFSNLESLLKYADGKSTSVQSNKIKYDKAKKAKLAAIAGIPDPSGNISFTYTNNTKLGVIIINDAQVTQGVQYNSNFNRYAEIKLFNLEGWSNFKYAKVNMEATATDNQLTRKSLYEDIASTYFNIVQLQEQLQATQENLMANDTLLKIAENKFGLGLLKKQDVNDTRVSYLNTKENVNQIAFQLQQQYTTLKIIADIPESDSIVIRHAISAEPMPTAPEVTYNSLSLNNSIAKERMALSVYRKNRFSRVPTLTATISSTEQQYNTNPTLFDDRVDWIPSSYIGFKASIPLPNASSMSSTHNAKYDYQLAKKNTEHVRIQTELNQRQLETDYSKAWSQYAANKEVYELKKDSYQKNMDLFKQGLLGTNQTLDSFNAMVNSHYNLISSAISVLLAQAKIDINNTVK